MRMLDYNLIQQEHLQLKGLLLKLLSDLGAWLMLIEPPLDALCHLTETSGDVV